MGLTVDKLMAWMTEQGFPKARLGLVLMICKCLTLNPLFGHIDWDYSKETGWEVFITIDDWISLIHRQPSFVGIAFNQASETENEVPVWMECTIYRSNFIQPITVRECYLELKSDHPIWEHMPSRMLRHKTLQECARLALAIEMPNLRQSHFKKVLPIHHCINKIVIAH